MDLNQVALSGNIGNDLELRHTKTGTAVLDFNLANNDGTKEQPHTSWFGIRVWGKSAEAFARFMSKGRKVIVWGRMTQEEWEDKETGKKRSKTIVIAENWTFGDSDKGGQSGDRAPRQEAPRRESPAPSRREVPSGGGDDGDDIPFAPFEKHSPLPL